MMGTMAKTQTPPGYRASFQTIDEGKMCSNCKNSIGTFRLCEKPVYHCCLGHPERRIKGYWICDEYGGKNETIDKG